MDSDHDLWKIDPERSSLTFNLRHTLLGEIRGQLRCWGGRVLVDPVDPTLLAVHVWADLSSLDTGSTRRNDALLDADLFDMQWEPALVFDSDSVEVVDGGGAVVMGWLSVGSSRKRMAISVQAGSAFSADAEAPRFVAKARAAIDRHEFGLHRHKRAWDWLSEQFVGRHIDIVAHVELVPAAPAIALLTGFRAPRTLASVMSRTSSSSHLSA
jgi:polyisoprenoid-binding protein YceI